MFLIEYMKGRFVNGEDIVWISVDNGVKFSVTASAEASHNVSQECEEAFLRKLQAYNNGYSDVESRYYELKGR